MWVDEFKLENNVILFFWVIYFSFLLKNNNNYISFVNVLLYILVYIF